MLVFRDGGNLGDGASADYPNRAVKLVSRDARQLAASAGAILELGPGNGLRVDLRRTVSPEARAGLHALGLTGPFAIVTPCNPRGEPVGDAANAARWEGLRRELLAEAIPAIPADGVSPDGTHREPGFAVPLGRGAAVALAIRWDQLALYWFDGEAFWVLPALASHPPLRLPADDVESGGGGSTR